MFLKALKRNLKIKPFVRTDAKAIKILIWAGIFFSHATILKIKNLVKKYFLHSVPSVRG